MQWSVVVPVKRLARAKTRLQPPDGVAREELALAMALDTVRAVAACAPVTLTLVVTDDPLARDRLAELGAQVVADEPDAGLNAALRHGAAAAAARRPAAGIALLSCDLPALRAEELADALAQAGRHDVAVVADLAGTGTVLLAARTAAALQPAFGAGSLAAHRAAGATQLPVPASYGLRQDVDTAADLERVRRLGVGPHTRALLTGAADRSR